MAKTAAEMVRGAFERARGRTAAVHYVGTSTGGFATYSVDSSACVENAYSVTVDVAGQFRCTCPASDSGKPACWHRAAVAIVRASRQGFGLPADGPTAEELRAAEAVKVGSARVAFELLLKGDVAGAERAVAPLRSSRSCAEIAALFAA
jgi:hypothetical protein